MGSKQKTVMNSGEIVADCSLSCQVPMTSSQLRGGIHQNQDMTKSQSACR